MSQKVSDKVYLLKGNNPEYSLRFPKIICKGFLLGKVALIVGLEAATQTE